MYLIGLTGGIASGKTVVANRLADRGAVVIDADKLARQVVEPGTPALAAIAETFGPGMLTTDGSLDRAALGALVFTDQDKLAQLNAITHPAVKQRAGELIAQAEQRDPQAIVVYDVPLLIEASVDKQHPFDLIVVVHADAATRIERLVAVRGLDRDEAVHRLNSQASDSERLAVADLVIDSNETLDETLRQADVLFERASRAVSAA